MKSVEYRSKLFFLFVAWWAFWAYQPHYFSDWALENVLTICFLAILILTRNAFRLSNISYTVLFLFLLLHTIGGHYTYAEVPYEEWTAVFSFSINDFFGFTRNHFDRLVHFLFGFLFAYPMREFFMRVATTQGAWNYYLPVELVMSGSMLFELFEWAAAVVFGGDLGMAYLGTQGDVWDAHKDMGLATLGAMLGMLIVAIVNWRLQRDFADEFLQSLRVKIQTPLGEVKLREYKDDRMKGNE